MGRTFQQRVANYLLGNNALPGGYPPATVYIALTTGPITDGSSAAGEVSGGSYARVAYTNNGAAWTGSNGERSNANAITFPTATGSWGTVESVLVLDDPTGTAETNILYWATLSQNKAVDDGDTIRFEVGDLTITHN
jgi:hypothetical protein